MIDFLYVVNSLTPRALPKTQSTTQNYW